MNEHSAGQQNLKKRPRLELNYHHQQYHCSFVQRINMLLIALIIARSQRVCCHCQCLGRQPELTAGERGHHPSLLVSLLCIITVIIMITWPKPRYVRHIRKASL